MNNRSANLALDVVADDWQAGVSKLLRPFGIGRQEHRDAIDHADAGFKAGLSVMLHGLLGADRQVAQ